MTEQRVPYDLRRQSRDRLADWWAVRYDTSFFNHICGYTPEGRTILTGNNAVQGPSANRVIRQGNRDNDEDLTSDDTFDLTLIDAVRERAETANTLDGTGPLVRPIKMNGDDYYVMFLHDYQVTALRTRVETGQWLDIQRAAMQGGDVTNNPVFTGALGVYNGTILHKAVRVTNGVNSTDAAASVPNTKRAVLCGAQAVCMAFGSENGVTRHTWEEQLFDYSNQFGVSAGAIFGMKKLRYQPENNSATNAEDYGCIVVPTWAEAANTATLGAGVGGA